MAKLLIRGDTSANWSTVNPTLSYREIGLDMSAANFKVGDGVTDWAGLGYWIAGGGPGAIVVRTVVASVLTGTTMVPLDNTIPQITEGTQFMSASYTPQQPDSVITVDCHAHVSPNVGMWIGSAIFLAGQSDALTSRADIMPSNGGIVHPVLSHRIAPGSTDELVFSFRAGGSSGGTWTLNGSGGGGYHGEAMYSYLQVTEAFL